MPSSLYSTSLPPASVVTGSDAVSVDMNALHQVCIAGSAAGPRIWGRPAVVCLGPRPSAMKPIGIVSCNGPRPCCFNEATAFRRWKCSENVRGNRQHPYFNGAVAELQKMTYRGKHIKGLILGTTDGNPLCAICPYRYVFLAECGPVCAVNKMDSQTR